MKKLKFILLVSTLAGLFACSTPEKTKPIKSGYLKYSISQAELNNSANFKRYSYACKNFETGESMYLATYFPLSKESRLKENFGFYFQLNNGKAEPFDHIENKPLNAKGSRFEVRYQSYQPINGSEVELIAREQHSTYYKTSQGMRQPWLECTE